MPDTSGTSTLNFTLGFHTVASRISLFNDETRTQPANPYRDDLVGTLRAGYVNNGRPVSLDEWRFKR